MRTSESSPVKTFSVGNMPSQQHALQNVGAIPKERPASFLGKETFASVVASVPLVAIDLILKNSRGRVLFGRRRNPPAQGYLFVPGGRIHKNETLDTAFSRISRDELNLNISRSNSRFTGVFEHFYDTDFQGIRGKSTHYIVLAHSIQAQSDSFWLPLQQHSDYAWLNEEDISRHPDIHPYAKAYFTEEKI